MILLTELQDKKRCRTDDFLKTALGLILHAANNLRSHVHPESQTEGEQFISDCMQRLDSCLRAFVAEKEIIGGSMFGSSKLVRADQELKVCMTDIIISEYFRSRNFRVQYLVQKSLHYKKF